MLSVKSIVIAATVTAVVVAGAVTYKLTQDTSTSSSKPAGTSAAGPDDLLLEGEWTATASNPRVIHATGDFDGATAAIEGGSLVVRYSHGPNDYGSVGEGGGPASDTGTLSISCSTEGCGWELRLVQTAAGPPYRIVDRATLQPIKDVCDLPTPAGAWILRDVTDRSFRFTASSSGGHGRGDGSGDACVNTYQVLYDIEATRNK